jgi:hypothetical protein
MSFPAPSRETRTMKVAAWRGVSTGATVRRGRQATVK